MQLKSPVYTLSTTQRQVSHEGPWRPVTQVAGVQHRLDQTVPD